MNRLLRFIKTTIIGGLIFLVPIILIITVIAKAAQLLLKLSEPISKHIPVENILGLAIIDLISVFIIAIICFLAGLMARYTLLSRTIQRAESKFLWKLPGYAFVKGFTDSFSGDDSTGAMKTVIISLDDSSQVAFEVEKLEDGKSVVYVPGAPNPWAGSVLMVTSDRVKYLHVSMANAIKTFSMLGKGTVELQKKVIENTGD